MTGAVLHPATCEYDRSLFGLWDQDGRACEARTTSSSASQATPRGPHAGRAASAAKAARSFRAAPRRRPGRSRCPRGPALRHAHRSGRGGRPAQDAAPVHARTGRVLWEKAAHRRRPIASTTKIMTATLVLEGLPLDRIVKVPPAATRTLLVREGLRRNERVPAWKLLDGLLIFSGNDDAYALAAAASGSKPRFVKLMNEKARALGLNDSHFTSVSGVVDQGNYSSAWDLAALTRYALRDA